MKDSIPLTWRKPRRSSTGFRDSMQGGSARSAPRGRGGGTGVATSVSLCFCPRKPWTSPPRTLGLLNLFELSRPGVGGVVVFQHVRAWPAAEQDLARQVDGGRTQVLLDLEEG